MEYIISKNKIEAKDFIKKYKNKVITIKNKDIEIPVKLSKEKSIISSKLDYYTLHTFIIIKNELFFI